MRQNAPSERAKMSYGRYCHLMPMRCACLLPAELRRGAFTILLFGMLVRFPQPEQRAKLMIAFEGPPLKKSFSTPDHARCDDLFKQSLRVLLVVQRVVRKVAED